jgi:hypothetical protein
MGNFPGHWFANNESKDNTYAYGFPDINGAMIFKCGGK